MESGTKHDKLRGNIRALKASSARIFDLIEEALDRPPSADSLGDVLRAKPDPAGNGLMAE